MITGVALYKVATGEIVSLPKPNRHHNVIKIINIDRGEKPYSHVWTQGFVDDEGNFLNREEAGKHAFECSQIGKLTDMLFSEDLW